MEDGSGSRVRVAGSAFLSVRFQPASGASTYRGPRRFAPAGMRNVREVVRLGDFEAVLTWALGVDGRRPFALERDGRRVTVAIADG